MKNELAWFIGISIMFVFWAIIGVVIRLGNCEKELTRIADSLEILASPPQ